MDSFTVPITHPMVNINELLQQIFTVGSSPYEQLRYAIEREFRPNGSPDVTRMQIDRVNYDAESNSGTFRVVLDISYTFACEDVMKQRNNETSEWSFAITDHVVMFHSSPFAESRSTADEF